MTAPVTTTDNNEKVRRTERALSEILAQSLRRGFYGSARIEIGIQDGSIQHIRQCVERLEK